MANWPFEGRNYLEQLKGYVSSSDEFKISHLFKSLYGLKRAPHVCYDHFNA
jgi:hypothetical protein